MMLNHSTHSHSHSDRGLEEEEDRSLLNNTTTTSTDDSSFAQFLASFPSPPNNHIINNHLLNLPNGSSSSSSPLHPHYHYNPPPTLSHFPPPPPPPPPPLHPFTHIPPYTHQNPPTTTPTTTQPSIGPPAVEDDIDFSDAILNYINHILMEEDIELQESLDLQAKQQSLFEALGNPHPLSPSSAAAAPPSTSGVGDASSTRLRGRNNPYYNADVDPEEERSIKQAAIFTEPILRSKQFDIVLLHSMGEGAAALGAYRQTLQAEKTKTLHQNRQQNRTSARKGRGNRQSGKKNQVVDLRALLVRCAQAAAADDNRAATELLKTIRQSSSHFGDGNQRLAHCFADGLEARIAGTGSQIYKALVNKKTLAVDFLKAYHLYLASCPFRKISIFCANKTILIRAKDAMRVHIIDFGILYGFQWPTLIQRFAGREGGPPKLKITGIEFPQSGFRPAEQVEETGRRLAEYANMFGVPFEYSAIAKRWDAIKAEDIEIEDGELVVVNCMYRFKNILDETASLESSRSIVLKTVKEMKPDIFVHGVVNGAYNAPFFVTRFREALFHFSSLFDMLEATVPREIPERMLIEKEIFGREALNVIACEGWERVERPETYKQWQVRNVKAGFNQIPFDRGFMATATRKVSSDYHKDFVIDEDGKWLLMGWKGRTIYAMSCWNPL